MPTIFTHAIVPLAFAAAAGTGRISPKLAMAGAVFAVLPDADVVGFMFGIEYGDEWGHRGATHSLAFSALCAGLLSLLWEDARTMGAWLFLTFAMASHGLLDIFTDGGLGAALWWPLSDTRVFASVTPVRVSPIGASFFSLRGVEALMSELRWIWAPSAILALAGWGVRHATRSRR